MAADTRTCPEDRVRDSKLHSLGYRVIRIGNTDVIENIEGVLQTLLSKLEKPPLTPSPRKASKRGEGDNRYR